jgi:hypothetical protein
LVVLISVKDIDLKVTYTQAFQSSAKSKKGFKLQKLQALNTQTIESIEQGSLCMVADLSWFFFFQIQI